MTTSALLTTADGRQAMLIAAQHLLKRRLSRFFKRNLVIDYNQWLTTGQFPLATLLGQLNGLNDPEILNLYHLLGIVGGLPVSIADTTIYVNSVTGSDVNGYGNATSPFASLWFMDLLPRRLNHHYRVVLMSDVNEPTTSLHLDFSFGENGSFAILGSGAPTVLAASAIGTHGTLKGSGGTYVACTAGLGIDAGDSFLMCRNYAVPIHRVYAGANAIIQGFAFSWAGVMNGDPVSVIRPARTLTIRNIIATCSGGRRIEQSQVGLFNLVIDFPTTFPPAYNEQALVKWENQCGSTISFVKFSDRYAEGGPGNTFKRGSVNMGVFADHNDVITLAACGVTNLDAPDISLAYNTSICGAKFGNIATGGLASGVTIDSCKLLAMDFNSAIIPIGSVYFRMSNARKFNASNCTLSLYQCVLDGLQSAGPIFNRAGIEATDCVLVANNCTILGPTDCCIALNGNVNARVIDCGTDATYSAIAVSGIHFIGNNNVGLVYTVAGTSPVTEALLGAVTQCQSYCSAGSGNFAYPSVDISKDLAVEDVSGKIYWSRY